jgi:hypothetical protein
VSDLATRSRWWPPTGREALTLMAFGLQVITLGAVLTGIGGAVRVGVALVYLLVVPGWAAIGLLDLGEPATEAMLCVATSVALATIVAQGLVWATSWSVTNALWVLTALVVPLLTVQLRRSAHRHRAVTHA